MRIIGIDPGIEKTGFAVLETKRGARPALLDCGCIRTSKSDSLSARLVQLKNDLTEILLEWKPSAGSVELIFFSKNVKTAITVAHARGVILEVLAEHGVALTEFTPNQIKASVTGDATADKKQVQKMVHYELGIVLKNDDTIDAIAGGLCLIAHKKYLS